MQIFGLMMVRNEVDILRVNILHHLALGIDQLLIVDNASTDGTDQVLQALSRDQRVVWRRETGAFRQAQMTTELAREAFLRGADWVIPIDADEFWYAPGNNFRQVLEQTTADVLEVDVVNFIQRRDQLVGSPAALLHMTRRVPQAIGPLDRIQELVETRQIAYVEMLYPPKCISRASFTLEVHQGNHSVDGITGSVERTSAIQCLHAPLRARSILESKVDQGRRVEELNLYLQLAWHVRRWRRLAENEGLAAEWEANSYADEALNVYGTRHPVIFDPRLRDSVAPWLAETHGLPMTGLTPLPLDHRVAQMKETILARMHAIDGFLFEAEAELLMRAVARALTEGEPHAVVEIGSYQGKSTVVLASVVKALASPATVYAIDPHEGELGAPALDYYVVEPTLERFKQNIAEASLSQTVELIQQRSYEVTWDQPISLLFIDGLHDYQNAKRDFDHFESWVVPGGYIVFHDYGDAYAGLKAFIDEVLGTGHYQHVELVESMLVTQKTRLPNNANRTEAAHAPPARRGAARYELPIDVTSDTTHARVVRLVGENKRVLELGCATGFMSRVFRERGCQVVGIEIDADAASVAATVCERVVIGDIDQLDFAHELGQDNFDVIVAADVLEHLKDPQTILATLKQFLRPDGYIVASLPNVAHGSIRLALLDGRFSYAETGLLDRTHLRFYTRQSMTELFENAGFILGQIERKEQSFDETEVPDSQVELYHYLLNELAQDPDARTFQFIVTAYPTPTGEAQDVVQHRLHELAEAQAIAERELAELRPLRQRLARQEQGVAALRAEIARLRDQVAARDRTVLEQHARLSGQISERDQIIRDLQAELHAKVGERDNLIRGLQAELQAAVDVRDQMINELQARLVGLETSLADKDQTNQTLTTRLLEKEHMAEAFADQVSLLHHDLDTLQTSKWWKVGSVYWSFVAWLRTLGRDNTPRQ